MTELLAHLVGDYVLQSQPMADRKVSSLPWAVVHAAFYTLPFLLLTTSPAALLVIGGTHALIDRYRVAARWCAFYGSGSIGGLWGRFSVRDEPPPPFLTVWLTIIVDNTFHLCINHFALVAR